MHSILILVIVYFLLLNRKKQLISGTNFFNILSILYFGYGLFLMREGLDFYQYKKLSILSIIAVVAFNYSRINVFRKVQYKKIKENKLMLFTGCLVICFSLLLFFILVSKIGINNYFFKSRAVRIFYLKKMSYLNSFKPFFMIGLILLYQNYFSRKNKRLKKFLIFLNSLYLILALLENSRLDIMNIFIVNIYFFEKEKIIKKKTIIILGIMLIFILLYYKSFMYSLKGYDIKIQRNFGELTTWIKNYKKIDHSSIEFEFKGEAFKSMMKSFIIPLSGKNDFSMTKWFMNKYYPQIFKEGGGRGFSGVLDAYMNAKYIGVFIYFYILGLFSYCFEKRRESCYFEIIYIFVILNMMRIFRSEFQIFTKSMWWYTILPVLIIFIFNKFIKKII
ncbi:oligosaccharide repeat unit polymerase [Fusobacteria bacterium ZRK30]|nr:oligosaccharide repeat unit polymerase [Fusobacteria bacterium ZRK30]